MERWSSETCKDAGVNCDSPIRWQSRLWWTAREFRMRVLAVEKPKPWIGTCWRRRQLKLHTDRWARRLGVRSSGAAEQPPSTACNCDSPVRWQFRLWRPARQLQT